MKYSSKITIHAFEIKNRDNYQSQIYEYGRQFS